ncbi:MAG: hypothetical protein GY861_11240 [bacterium]|nr:hypothetical protein [bacterium]
MKLLIDWSVICHGCWHVMRSPNYESRTDIEEQEFARNLATTMLYLRERFKPEETIIALDAKGDYWRHGVYADYYKTHIITKRLIQDGEEKYYLEYDKRAYLIHAISGTSKYVSTKLNKKTKAEALENETIKDVTKLPEEVKKFIPSYKGNRKTSSWDYATTRAEWHVLCDKIVKNLAFVTQSKVIRVEEAEADDIAYVYAKQVAAHDSVFVTTDSDWSQLLANNLFLKLYNPTMREFNLIPPEDAKVDLAVKLLSGDVSDNIMGVSVNKVTGKKIVEATATLGKDRALNLVDTVGISKIYAYLEEYADKDALYRNYELICLNNMPQDLEDAIELELKKAKIPMVKKPLAYSHFGVEKKDILVTKAEAKGDRQQDEDEGIFER